MGDLGDYLAGLQNPVSYTQQTPNGVTYGAGPTPPTPAPTPAPTNSGGVAAVAWSPNQQNPSMGSWIPVDATGNPLPLNTTQGQQAYSNYLNSLTPQQATTITGGNPTQAKALATDKIGYLTRYMPGLNEQQQASVRTALDTPHGAFNIPGLTAATDLANANPFLAFGKSPQEIAQFIGPTLKQAKFQANTGGGPWGKAVLGLTLAGLGAAMAPALGGALAMAGAGGTALAPSLTAATLAGGIYGAGTGALASRGDPMATAVGGLSGAAGPAIGAGTGYLGNKLDLGPMATGALRGGSTAGVNALLQGAMTGRINPTQLIQALGTGALSGGITGTPGTNWYNPWAGRFAGTLGSLGNAYANQATAGTPANPQAERQRTVAEAVNSFSADPMGSLQKLQAAGIPPSMIEKARAGLGQGVPPVVIQNAFVRYFQGA